MRTDSESVLLSLFCLRSRQLLFDDLHLSGCGIPRDYRELVLTAHHVGRLGNIPGQMDRVKFAASRAQAAADAAVEVDDRRAAAKTP